MYFFVEDTDMINVFFVEDTDMIDVLFYDMKVIDFF